MRIQTEVSELLQLIIHSLYSHPEIFLRELISNSSDALDKLRHLTLTDDAYKTIPFDPRIDLELDEEKKTLSIADTGIGMNRKIWSSIWAPLPAPAPRPFSLNSLGTLKGFQSDRSVWGRLLQRLHGRRSGGGSLPQGRRRAGVALDERWQKRLRDGAHRALHCGHHRPASFQ